MPAKKTIALLFGGRSAEHEVSIQSASAVYGHLDKTRYTIICLYIARDGRWKRVASPLVPPGELRRGVFHSFLPWQAPGSAALRADLYFPVLHGPYGEDGTIQGLLEMADVPFVGPGVLASAAGMDKDVMKALFQAGGLLVSPWIVIRDFEWRANRAAILRRIKGLFAPPYFVKPANLGSSVGISKVKAHGRAGAAIDLALSYDRKILVEKGIDGREIECAVLGNDKPRASRPGEVIPYNDFYDYRDKYKDGKTRFGIPADLPPEVTAEVRRQAVAAFRACQAEGLARVDFFLESKSGDLIVNEINTLPGFTEISMYPKLWGITGLPYGKLLDRLIALGFERHRRKKRRTAGAMA
ncbi:MAG: D-alanine--D-alanine ligase [Acidobacteriota bacterium]|nr:D-alanine--D-alanine ligase [Acidobacteriota bacterium]